MSSNKKSREEKLKQEIAFIATKHTGGLKSTKELVSNCNIKKNDYVLDVGCGLGTTACSIAKEYGCKIVGIDISKKMVEWSKKRAKKEGLEDFLSFRVADAQNLPFNENSFDVVIAESVNAFVDDKQKAINEYTRVVKPKGYVGLNEATWIKLPAPKEIMDAFSHIHKMLFDVGLKAYKNWVNENSAESWDNLLKNAGLINRNFKTFSSNTKFEVSNRIKTVGLVRIIRIYFYSLISKRFRTWLKKIAVPEKAFEYYGYGIYIGQKP